MTQIQLDYRKFMENQRHNLEMERLGEGELETKRIQAQASKSQAESAMLGAQTAAERANYQSAADLGKTFESIGKGFSSAVKLGSTVAGLFA